ENRIVRRYRVNRLFGGQRCAGPLLVVPIAAQNPPAFRKFFGVITESSGKLRRRLRIAEVHVRYREAAHEPVDVGIVEAGKNDLFTGIYHARVRTRQWLDLRRGTHGDDSVADEGDRGGGGLRLVHRVNRGIDNNKISGEGGVFGDGSSFQHGGEGGGNE